MSDTLLDNDTYPGGSTIVCDHDVPILEPCGECEPTTTSNVTTSEPSVEDCRKPTTKALGLCAKWLQWCLHNGWAKSALDDLERLWWEYHDENGDLVDQPRQRDQR